MGGMLYISVKKTSGLNGGTFYMRLREQMIGKFEKEANTLLSKDREQNSLQKNFDAKRLTRAVGGSKRVHDGNGNGGSVMRPIVNVFSTLLLIFNHGVSVHSQGLTQPQCECITPPPNALQQCLPYDSRLQAATVEEAMLSFPDLTIDQDIDANLNTLQDALISTCVIVIFEPCT
ncbi:hypothetical protein KIN20_007263 [Parelaphostrongylus tenuis]|uniref:Uncharacterized protein n=1 Tax=Parelaphostrongylus tenuis TaxID=148309 RepID=A0AAD5QJW6_PARTN|nr:hypothetical protein KIN20_007263 [Parelaphostrongylus tenuis]